jgi:hypothetical protein
LRRFLKDKPRLAGIIVNDEPCGALEWRRTEQGWALFVWSESRAEPYEDEGERGEDDVAADVGGDARRGGTDGT